MLLRSNSLCWETLVRWHLISDRLVTASSSAWERWEASLAQNTRNTGLLKVCSHTLLTFLLCGDNCLRPSLSNQLLLSSVLCVSDGQELHELWLADDAGAWVVAAVVALPVCVVGDVTSWESDSVVVAARVESTWCWEAELWVQWDTVGTLWGNGEDAADLLPDALGLDSVFLTQLAPEQAEVDIACALNVVSRQPL